MNSEQLFERSKKVSPGGVHSPVRSFKGLDRAPVFFEKAKGPYLYSVEGKQYIDFCQSFGPLILGHLDDEVMSVVEEMIHKAWTFGACEAYSLELAEFITQNIPWVEKLRFVSSGTEAVMSALRVARAATGKNKILKFDGCYHGHVDSLLVKAGSGLAGESASSSAGVPADVAHNTLIAKLDNETELEEVFKVHGNDIAALIIEPLPANYGLLIQRTEFLQKCRTLCSQYGALLIFDEVISGFRVAMGGMAEITGITPDLVTYGKIIGGGFPVGCYGGKKEYLDLVAPLGAVYQAGTLSANPIGMTAGLATLKKMKRIDGWNALAQKTETFVSQLQKEFTKSNAQVEVSSHRSLFWIHSKTNGVIRNLDKIPQNLGADFKKLFLAALNQGVYLAPNAYEVGFLSIAHSEEVLNKAVEVISNSARQ